MVRVPTNRLGGHDADTELGWLGYMQVIPHVILQTNSSAERRVFDLLQEVDIGPGWTAFHSLNCSEHSHKQWSEIDFLLVGPDGLFVLEVKGGGISLQDGIWTYHDRYGRGHEHSEGPFEQAKTARFALEDLLEDRFELRSLPIRPRFGFGVVFPDSPWTVESPEMPREIVADQTKCASADSLATALKRMISYWSSKVKQTRRLESSELKALRRMIRPNVDVYPPFTVQLGHTVRQLQSLTEEQYELMDSLEDNDRVVVSGGAGTGKTFVLLQGARRELAKGRSVLVVTHSEILAAHIRGLEPSQNVHIRSYRALARENPSPYDVLFVDEGQDLLSLDVLDLLGKFVEGGMERGRWRWFMDENNQARLAGRYDTDARDMLLTGLGSEPPVRLNLRRNVRNTRPIVEAVERWTGSRVGAARADGYGSPPSEITIETRPEILEAVERRLAELAEMDIPMHDVGIVASDELKSFLLEGLSRRWKRKAQSLDLTTIRANMQDKFLIGTAAEYKGLERPIQIVVGLRPGPSDLEMAAFYVGTTRANYDLTVIRIADAANAR